MTTTKPRFHLIGAGGYIARKHLDAIRNVGGELITACDLVDSVGILDGYNLGCIFHLDIDEARCHWEPGDYVVVASPNDMHVAHAELALQGDCNVICEKPVTFDPVELVNLEGTEAPSKGTFYPVLQMRYHPLALWMQDVASAGFVRGKIDYVTPRGLWYKKSWKADPEQSGGLIFNIGIHLIDLLTWTFGEPTYLRCKVDPGSKWNKATGNLVFENAEFRWRISLNPDDAPRGVPHRTFTLNEETRDIENPPNCLHTEVYTEILAGRGYVLEDVIQSLQLGWHLGYGSNTYEAMETHGPFKPTCM